MRVLLHTELGKETYCTCVGLLGWETAKFVRISLIYWLQLSRITIHEVDCMQSNGVLLFGVHLYSVGSDHLDFASKVKDAFVAFKDLQDKTKHIK